MRLTYIFTSLALVLRCIALVILAPAAVAVYYKDWHSIIPFVGASLLSFVLSFLFTKKSNCKKDLFTILKKIKKYPTALVGTVG